MANDIVNFPNSFIRFCETRGSSCNEYDGVVLPVTSSYDFRFMVQVNDTTTAYLDTLNFYLVPSTYGAGEEFTLLDIHGFWALDYALISGTNYAAFTHDPLCDETVIPSPVIWPADIGDCMRIVLAVSSTRTIVCVADPMLQQIGDTCFTNVIRYKCPDNSYGFLYEEVDAVAETPFYNKVRLNITLQSPQPLTKKTGFELSDGSFRTLAASKQKEWEVDVDYLDDYFHQCLDAAIDHDTLYVYQEEPADICDYSDEEFFHDQEDKYDIDWQEKPGQHLGVAKAKFKLKTNPYYSQNSNC